MSQNDKIANILRTEGKIDNFRAIDTKLTYRLGARIFDLRRKGWVIQSKEDGKNCIYTLISEPKPEQGKLKI